MGVAIFGLAAEKLGVKGRFRTIRAFFLALALLAGIPSAEGVKYVAVVESELDAASGAAADINSAEVRQITAELRREAVKNLPRDKYTIMTSETVIAQGGAVLEACAEENCVITLGSKIGADYIVRGVISKFKTRLTLSVEMYETEDGTLVASSDPVRSENAAELLEKASAACADMYKAFLSSQNLVRKTQAAPAAAENFYRKTEPEPEFTGRTAAQTADEPAARKPKPKPKQKQKPGYVLDGRMVQVADAPAARKPMTGFSLGMYRSETGKYGGVQNHTLYQIGIAHSRPVTEKTVSLNAEGNVWAGSGYYDNGGAANPSFSGSFGFFGFNLPVTALFQLGVFSLEAGAHGDLLFGDGETLFNAGLTAGAGVGFSRERSRRYFYRYNSGYNYGTHLVGMRWLF